MGTPNAFAVFTVEGASFEIVSLDVTAGDDVVYAHALLRCGTPQELAEQPANRLRLTLGLRKEQGRGTGTLEGLIAEEQRGEEGFGYDPVFVPEGQTQTVAELGNEWKREHSHRARAARSFQQAVGELRQAM